MRKNSNKEKEEIMIDKEVILAILAKLPNSSLPQIVNRISELEPCLSSGLSHTAAELALAADDLQRRLRGFVQRVEDELPAS